MPPDQRGAASPLRHMLAAGQVQNVNEQSSSGVISGDPLVAVKSGEYSAQQIGTSNEQEGGSKRDEPYKYYDGGASEASARMRQAQNPIPRYANKQLYEPRSRDQYE